MRLSEILAQLPGDLRLRARDGVVSTVTQLCAEAIIAEIAAPRLAARTWEIGTHAGRRALYAHDTTGRLAPRPAYTEEPEEAP